MTLFITAIITIRSSMYAEAEADSTQKTVLYNIMDNTYEQLQAYARNLLIYTDGLEYHEPYIEIDTSQLKNAVAGNNINFENNRTENRWFKLYPNPAKEYITIEYNLDYTVKNAVVEIITTNGNHIETFRLHGLQGVKIVDLRRWQRGTYIIRLSNKGKTLQNEKFVKY